MKCCNTTIKRKISKTKQAEKCFLFLRIYYNLILSILKPQNAAKYAQLFNTVYDLQVSYHLAFSNTSQSNLTFTIFLVQKVTAYSHWAQSFRLRIKCYTHPGTSKLAPHRPDRVIWASWLCSSTL